MTTKVCSSCNQSKPLSEFHKHRGTRDGLSGTCKVCACARTAAWMKAHPEQQKKNARSAYLRNRDEYIQRASQWKNDNPAKRRSISATWSRNNRARLAVAQRRRRQNNLDAYRAVGRRAAAIRRERELLNDQSTPISLEWWQTLFEIIETKACVYCGRAPVALTMDHFIPVTKGGKTEIGNLIPCCKPCNSSKSNHDPEEWIKERCGGQAAYDSILLFLWATKEAYEEEMRERAA